MILDRDKIAQYCEVMQSDLLKFGFVITPNLTYDKSSCVLHRDIADIHANKPRFSAIIAPRGHAKTTWASTIATAHDIAYDTEDVIVLIKKTYVQATTDLQNIVSIIKYNERFGQFYGPREFLTDRQDKVYILNPATGHKTWVEVKGAGQSIRGIVVEGNRCSKILMDDFEDENNTLTKEQREKVRNWITAQIMPSLNPRTGHILAIGTIVHYDSWLCNVWEKSNQAIRDGRQYSWKVIYHQVRENGAPIWPERFSDDYIKEIENSYIELGKVNLFYQEYYNIPFNVDDAHFRKEHISYFDGELTYDPDDHVHVLRTNGQDRVVDCVVAYDPSTGIGKDYTGKVVLLTDRDGKRYLHHADRHRFKPDELIADIFQTDRELKPRLIVLEEEAMAVIFDFWLKSEMRRTQQFVRLKGEKVPRTKSKEDKIAEGLQPVYAAGVMHHRRGQHSIEEELFTFPKGKSDDILDALWLASKHAKLPNHGFIAKVKERLCRTIDREGIDWMTGATFTEYDGVTHDSEYSRVL